MQAAQPAPAAPAPWQPPPMVYSQPQVMQVGTEASSRLVKMRLYSILALVVSIFMIVGGAGFQSPVLTGMGVMCFLGFIVLRILARVLRA